MEYLILLEFDNNSKNKRLLELLSKKSAKKLIVKQSKDKVVIKEALFDVLQFTIEQSDIDYLSLLVLDDEGKTSIILKDFELFTHTYDEMLRTMRFTRRL